MKSSFNARSTTDDVLEGIDLTGKTVLLTGCNSGLGFETLRQMTARGAHVIAAARNLKTAQEACAKAGGSTTQLACDLSNFSSVNQAIAVVHATGRRVDIVIANAVIMARPELAQIDGLETQFVVNYLSHFMLITGILDMIPQHAGARIVILASSAHTRASPAGIEWPRIRRWPESPASISAIAKSLNRARPRGTMRWASACGRCPSNSSLLTGVDR